MTQPISRFLPSIVPTFLLKARLLLFLAAIAFGLGAFAKAQTTAKASSAEPHHVAEPGQKTFPSANAAMEALYAANKSGDTNALLEIFGPGGKELIFSGDEVLDKNGRQTFIDKYEEMHRLVQESEHSYTLEIGAENWPLPIPIVEADDAWFFDTASGKEELLYRRIGKNELGAIETMGTLVGAQIEYESEVRPPATKRQYAAKFFSTPGTQNGLYWNSGESDASPIGPLIADAAGQGYSGAQAKRSAYQGYYFRMLTRQGAAAQGGAKDYVDHEEMTRGFAFLAYPAEYRNSGVMTFIVDKDGQVYQKDLGPNTASLAKAMTAYNPDKTWEKIE
jgi:hypothetical protein